MTSEITANPAIAVTAALALSVALCFLLAWVAGRLGWIDKPDWRKQHAGDIPLAGGPAIFVAVLGVLAWHGGWGAPVEVFAWSSSIVFLTGLIDDRRHIRVPVRFALQAAALLCMVVYADVKLYNFGRLFSDDVLGLGPLVVPITVFSALGVINAFNMIDGLDGLAGSLALVSLAGLAFLAGRGGFAEAHAVLLIVAAAVLGFLLLNFRFPWRERALVFLGDSGSSWLGFVMAWFFIALSQHDSTLGIGRAYAPVTAIWLIGLPLMDTTYVMIRRARLGEPIFGADRRHLHHLFLRTGRSVRTAWAAMTGIALLFALIGIWGELRGWPEWAMFYAAMGICAGYFLWMHRVWKTRRFLGREVV